MIHVSRLGPVSSGGSEILAYVGLEDGGVPRIHLAADDRAGLAALRAEVPGPLACEPTLAEAGSRLEIEAAPLSAALLRQRAVVAFELACGVEHGASRPEAIEAFLKAAAAFWGARAWEVLGPDDCLQVTLSGGRNQRAGAVAILGGTGGTPGLALCDEPATLEQLATIAGPERVAGLRRLASLTIEMEATPAWAAAAIGEAFTLTRVPVAGRTRGGRVVSVATQDLVLAAALLEATAACAAAGGQGEVAARVEAADLAVVALVAPVAAGAVCSLADVVLTPVRPGSAAAEGEVAPIPPPEAPPGPVPEPPSGPPVAAAAPPPGGGEGWLERIGRALRGRRPPSPAPRREEAPPAAVAPAPPAPRPPPLDEPAPVAATPAPSAPEPPFAPFARALGLELPAEAPPPSAEEEAADSALAATLAERAAGPGAVLVSFPAAALQILELVRDPKSDAGRVAGYISRDPALSAGVISVANSAALRGRSEVESVREAVARLGMEEVGRVASAVSARAVLDPGASGKGGGGLPRLFTRAVAVSWAAAAAAMRQRGARSDHVYLGALLHDVGWALAGRALDQLVADGIALTETARAERVLDRVHAGVGTAALQRWGLPQYLTEMCIHHHDEVIPPEQVDLHLVRLTSALAQLREPAHSARAAREIVQSAAALGLGVHGVRALAADLRDAEQRAAALAR